MVNYNLELNSEQQKAVLEGDGPCLVLAGAGSGKTRVITYRVAYLLEKGVLPENILLLTFTNKAAKEMLSRVDSLLAKQGQGNEISKKIVGGTFHSAANFFLRKYAPVLGYKNNFTILDDEDSTDFMNFSLKESSVDTSSKRFPSAHILKNLWSYARNSSQTLAEAVNKKYPDYLQFLTQMSEVVNIYEGKKRSSNSMDFDDLLLNFLAVLRGKEDIRAGLSERFHYVLVDEYQDTNKIQAEMVYLLASRHKNIFVVGDDAQSIYSFRAAEVKNILDFPRVYPDAKVFRLETNYRSTPDILDFANAVISQNPNQFPKNLKSPRPRFVRPQFAAVSSMGEEAKYIVSEILKLYSEGTPLKKIAVLFRAAFHSQALEMELVKRNIPYDYRGGVRFFERAHIKDVISYLRILHNPKDGAAWTRLLMKQRGIGKGTADKILAAVKNADSLRLALEMGIGDNLSAKAKFGWDDFSKIAKSLTRENNHSVSGLISVILKNGYYLYLETEYIDAKDRLEDLEGLALFAAKYEDLGAFLSDSSLQESFGMKNEGEDSGNPDKIILSTIHQAKGLEWDVVFIINLTDNSIPNRRALFEDSGEEEERRLFYVAITRAKDYLYLTYPITGIGGSSYYNSPSRFLSDIPGCLLEKEKVDGGSLPVIEI